MAIPALVISGRKSVFKNQRSKILNDLGLIFNWQVKLETHFTNLI